MVILKSQTRVKLTRPQLKTHVRGVQNTQDHFKGPHWTRVLSGSVPRISDARPPPQAANAHTAHWAESETMIFRCEIRNKIITSHKIPRACNDWTRQGVEGSGHVADIAQTSSRHG